MTKEFRGALDDKKPKPETFDMADKIKVIGAYRDGAFQADDMILKCPSKYNSNAPTPGKPGEKTSQLGRRSLRRIFPVSFS